MKNMIENNIQVQYHYKFYLFICLLFFNGYGSMAQRWGKRCFHMYIYIGEI